MTPQRWLAPAEGVAHAARTAPSSAGGPFTDLASTISPYSCAILGRRLDSNPCTPALHAWIEHHWRHDEHESDRHPHRILLHEPAVTPDVPSGDDGFPVDVRLPDGHTLHGRARGAEWHTGDGGGGVQACFDVWETRIAVWGTMNRARQAPVAPRARLAGAWPALYVAMCEAMRASGLVPLHAAVVVRGCSAYALTGRSGAGKTTTLIRLLDRGWRPLAEDFSWLDPASRTLYGWDRGLRLWSDALASLAPRFATAPWTIDRDGKRLLPWSAVPAERAPQATLASILLLERDAARPSSITRLSRRAAVRVLWEATGIPLIPWIRESMAEHIARLAQTVELARFTLGTGDLPDPDSSFR